MSIRLEFLGQEQPLEQLLGPLLPHDWGCAYSACPLYNNQLPSLSIEVPLRFGFPFCFASPYLLGPALTGHFPAIFQALCPLSVE